MVVSDFRQTKRFPRRFFHGKPIFQQNRNRTALPSTWHARVFLHMLVENWLTIGGNRQPQRKNIVWILYSSLLMAPQGGKSSLTWWLLYEDDKTEINVLSHQWRPSCINWVLLPCNTWKSRSSLRAFTFCMMTNKFFCCSTKAVSVNKMKQRSVHGEKNLLLTHVKLSPRSLFAFWRHPSGKSWLQLLFMQSSWYLWARWHRLIHQKTSRLAFLMEKTGVGNTFAYLIFFCVNSFRFRQKNNT